MADPSSYRPKPGEIPDSPGVYRFIDAHGRVIYVGKAKSLRSRLASYFQDLAALHPRTQQMVTTAASVDWTVVETEVASLALEYAWIKEFDPRFNVKYRDDKSYPFLAVTMGEEVPRVQVMRGAKRKGTRYFGPYSHAWAIRETVDLLLRVFPVRTCSAGVYRQAAASGRPCLLGYIDKCAAPCVGKISIEDHRQLAEDFCAFMAGKTKPFVRRLEADMKAAAADLDFERAARLRDDLAALTKVVETNEVVLPDGTDADVFAMVADDLEAAVQVFHVRDGRVRGRRGWVVEKVEDVSDAELVERLVQQVYGDATLVTNAPVSSRPATGNRRTRPSDRSPAEEGATGPAASAVPREVLVPVEPTNAGELTAWLGGIRGAQVSIRVPQRGDKRKIAETVRRNAEQALALHKTRRAGDLSARSAALADLAEALGLPDAPLRIECFDVSHTQGTEQVASMVVFEDGLARKDAYRTFVIRGKEGTGARDDTEAIAEVITRRLRQHLNAQRPSAQDLTAQHVTGQGLAAGGDGSPGPAGLPDETAEADAMDEPEAAAAPGRPQRFAYPPNLLVVDGGAPQVAAAARAMAELGVSDIALIGLAKRLEEVWLPEEDFPLVLPRTSPGLFLLQRLRDEAHRFALSHHRRRRSKAMTRSALDDVPGLGPTRAASLLAAFGSVTAIRRADVEQIAAVTGIGPRTAEAIVATLRPADRAAPDPTSAGTTEAPTI